MTGVDLETLTAAASWDREPITILESGPQTRALIPEQWWPVAEAAEPQARRHSALALWNADFLELIPRFAEALRTVLVDVRVAKHAWLDAPSLDYVLRTWNGELAVWVGEDPRTFGDAQPPLFDSLPEPARAFTSTVHAGFTSWDGQSCGLIAPRLMKTLAAHWGAPDDNQHYEWDAHDYAFPGTQRLLFLTDGVSDALLCTSPDLPAGTAVTYYEPDFEVHPFGESLDEFMIQPVEG